MSLKVFKLLIFYLFYTKIYSIYPRTLLKIDKFFLIFSLLSQLHISLVFDENIFFYLFLHFIEGLQVIFNIFILY